MIEVYAILAGFAAQVLLVSVLQPAWAARHFRGKHQSRYADARYIRLFPGWDRARMERMLVLFRGVNFAIALLGLVPFYWLYAMMQDPAWDIWAVRRIISLFFMVQMSPFMVLAVSWLLHTIKARRHLLPQVKRTASLQRRSLFDFVSPVTISVAALIYVLGAAASLYFLRYPVPEISYPLRPLFPMTYTYVVNGVAMYWMIYGKKVDLLDSEAVRWHETGMGLRAMTYISILVVLHIWFNLALEVAHVERWIPLTSSILSMAIILVISRCFTMAPPQPESGGNLRRDEALS